MNKADAQRSLPQPTRRAILEILKRGGPGDARTLALALGLSPMAVRLHLYRLRDEGCVTYCEERRSMGRPRKLWRLTEAADRRFPDRHWELMIELLDAVHTACGSDGLERVLACYTKAQARRYLRSIRNGASLRFRLQVLCKLRSEEDFMADAAPSPDGGFILSENHCPIRAAAASFGELCGAERNMFQAVLGRSVTIKRCEHILAGDARCTYRISKRK
jgi:predicted ArsR family transcriptional regulator